MAVATGVALRLVGRHWETPNLAGAGWVETAYDLDPGETGFVALHLWNVGDAGGPAVPEAFLVDMGTRECQEESVAIAERYIRPAIAASRAAGLPIFHVEPASIALKYASARYLLEPEELTPAPPGRPRPPEELTPAPPGRPRPPEVNPGWNRQRAERTHGRGYMEWSGWEHMRILSSCEAKGEDQVIVTGRQFDAICRAKGIKNLVFSGFATNMCILDSAAATREMLSYGYRVFLIREATLGVEYPETFAERQVTAVALKYFELKVGDSLGYEQYIAACRAVVAGRQRPI